MESDVYQRLAARTLLSSPDHTYTAQEIMLVWNGLGLAGEAGEVAELLKKAVFHRHTLDLDKVKKELGDVLWYAAALCTTLDLSLSEVMALNVEKLRLRYEEGYNSADSIARKDVDHVK
jgi:NTP pyrophosphatase (non-canonical NTP hydrolase)